jgi:hypothetical protein
MFLKRNRTERRKIPVGVLVVVLQTGHDFFGDLGGTVEDNLETLRAAWQDEAIRQVVYKRHYERPGGPEPWAVEKFGGGQ